MPDSITADSWPILSAIIRREFMIPEPKANCVYAALGIFAWNEQEAIGPMLGSLFRQSLFAELARRNLRCEIHCVLNGCTDQTPEVAREFYDLQARSHPHRNAFDCSVDNLAERGKIRAWNQFVHSLSARSARFLIMMDADILIHREGTLWNMLRALEEDASASVSVDQPCKDLRFKRRKSYRERLSLSASQMTLSAKAQLCGQLYCIRSEVARNIYLPNDLAACEDGFIKTLVCTDFLTRPHADGRIRVAEQAEHTFEAYTSPAAIFKNQKRQMMGQTIVHLLVDEYLPALPISQRERLADTLREKERADPLWLKRLIAEHLRRTTFFWRLYPGLLGRRILRLANLSPLKKLACAPAVAAGLLVDLLASFMAHRALKNGCTDYWPRAQRLGLKPTNEHEPFAGGGKPTACQYQ